jgi:protoporphyrin/coproporphyrin ferrochelatase
VARDVGPTRRVAVVLFNLGGPDGPSAVRPFLFNLFSDPSIIGLPAPLRYPLAALISRLREKAAIANYKVMGGGSPLLPETLAQADALQRDLAAKLPTATVKVFIAMRYWRPLTPATAADVAQFQPDEIVLLPLYPQFSTTTTASSIRAWIGHYRGPGRTRTVCCYPLAPGLIEAHAARIKAALAGAPKGQKVRLLFSAHGLPEKVISAGDPYQRQVEATAAAVAERLGGKVDWKVCYQSRVGPMRWIGPSTIEAILEAAADGVGVVISPIAFVSEHVETLVELDHEYADLAESIGCAPYIRVAALGLEPAFIAALSEAALDALGREAGVEPGRGWTCEACGPICMARDKAVVSA